ncbi:hypothetical protein WUBG_05943 [Wuchereria bancrofti]|uniref:Uncharacterized protein n=1 Tax=Wuchereria bancrofti TaxID=6293 RepID=J9EL14_WUCBA|nr:hypothetical protein WUBG_05943 [Wuchereria bancrofti]
MGDIWWRVRYVWALCVPNIMFIMYIAIFHSIRRKRITITRARHERNAVKIRHYERSMLVQAAWHCGVLEVEHKQRYGR